METGSTLGFNIRNRLNQVRVSSVRLEIVRVTQNECFVENIYSVYDLPFCPF